ncbi:MAG TPA: VC_2705 family sodium/solute symporter [Bacteroidia bacterium]|nr:VC_2705 family sodium/solute symporter [Bacteroidia bacterium]HRS58282.1 VC_2705 family sodium/solute symporter [Bacteroidia bacterium]HRU67714.1 VC_2705 family sodium/solute symporter [Bacteroidia bacterium]
MKAINKLLLISAAVLVPFISSAAVTELEGSFKVGPAIILLATLLTFIIVGIIFRAKDTTDFYAAGRKISPVGAGMAIGSNWMSAASFLGMAALMYGSGYHGLAFVIGWTGGYVLLMVLMAGQIRRYGKYTAADFVGDRYYSKSIRLFAAIMVIIISIAYCVGQFGGIGLMFKWILGINYFWSVIIGGSVVLLYTLISGMLGATKNMQIQYVIIIVSFVIPLFILSNKYGYFWLLPPAGYGAAVSDIVHGIPLPENITSEYLTNVFGHPFAIMPAPEYAMPWDPSSGKSFFEFIAIAFSLMIGTAGLPHVLQRFYVVPNAKDARLSVVWGLFFICILYWGAPVYAAFGKLLSIHPEVGTLAKDAIVVYTAQLGDVHPLFVGLLAAGATSAAFSTVSGLFVAGASAFSHDIYVKVLNPTAKPKNQLFAARIGTILIAIIVTILALQNIGLIGELVASAFSIAACTLFPLFLLGSWWSGSNRAGGIAGLIMGMLITAISITYFVVGKAGGHLPGQEFISYYLQLWYFAWIGAPLAILTNIIVSLLTKPTPEHIKEFLAKQVHV